MAITKKEAKQAFKEAGTRDLSKLSKKALLGLYYEEARNADIRLKRLERLSDDPTYKPATQWAYARAVKDIEHIFGDGNNRFDKVLPAKANKNQIRSYINAIRTFRESPSSTKAGINEVYKKRADTINKKLKDAGISYQFTWQDLATYLSDGTYNRQAGVYGSATMWLAIGREAEKQLKDLKDGIVKSSQRVSRGDKKEALDLAVKYIDENGIQQEHLTPKRRTKKSRR